MTAHKDKQGLTHITRDYKPIETRKSSLIVSTFHAYEICQASQTSYLPHINEA